MSKDLPRGYKKRMDAATLTLMPEARRIMDICQEFMDESVVLSDGEIEVNIHLVSTGDKANDN